MAGAVDDIDGVALLEQERRPARAAVRRAEVVEPLPPAAVDEDDRIRLRHLRGRLPLHVHLAPQGRALLDRELLAADPEEPAASGDELAFGTPGHGPTEIVWSSGITSDANVSSVRIDSSKVMSPVGSWSATCSIEAGLEHRGEALPDLVGRAGTGGDRVLDVGEDGVQRRNRLLAVLGREDQMVVAVDVLCTPHQAVHSAAGDVRGFVLRWRDRHDHRGADARPAVRPVDAERPTLVLVPRLDVGVVGLLVDRSGPHEAHAVATGDGWVARVPERDRVLERLRRERCGREVVVDAALARDLPGGQRVADDPKRVLEALAAIRPVAAEPGVLDRRDAAADPEVEAAAGQIVGDAHVFQDADGVVEWEQLHHRPEPDPLRYLRRGGDEELLVRRHAELGAVVLGEMEAREAGLIGEADQVEAILEEPLRRCAGDVLDVVEDAERRLGHGN